MADTQSNAETRLGHGKKEILLNAFDMGVIGHLAPGQWKTPGDQGSQKHTLEYWVNLAKVLERGGFNGLFLADSYGGHDTYGGSLDECIRRASQWPISDPIIPISAMAAATKHLTFGVTSSTTFEPPFILARRFSTLDHMTQGRIGWNIVTSWKKSAFKAIGLDDPIGHDERYAQADEYLRVLYKLWEGSWADDAVSPNPEEDSFIDPKKVRHIKHNGKYFKLDSPHILEPSPQRTPFLFQAGTSSAGIDFASTHAEAIFVSGFSATFVGQNVAKVRAAAAAKGRDPRSIKVFGTICPIVAATDEEAQAKYEALKKNASVVGALVVISSISGIDLSRVPLDQDLATVGDVEANSVVSLRSALVNKGEDGTVWTPRRVAEERSIGGFGALAVGSPSTVADIFEEWVRVADLDGFNLSHATTPGTFEDVVELLVPELRRRGIYPEQRADDAPVLTARERALGEGQARVRDDHVGATYRFDVYKED
ncbi:xenobiotic compound monooxygenase, DszA family [Plectosphaerella cucumerina]|uniref:Xenobiotic compound monooxygenase, DszA family n=1 Tax=Plectosphaerella cucumerina TaxID=40658 RepID=A0A8K0WYY2_9PEZI|nr:xenobiotic compound monooxygenase, DszA family [Plectosphaerella cucumerina]